MVLQTDFSPSLLMTRARLIFQVRWSSSLFIGPRLFIFAKYKTIQKIKNLKNRNPLQNMRVFHASFSRSSPRPPFSLRTAPKAPLQEVINSSRHSPKIHTRSQTRTLEFVSMGRTCTWLESVSNFLITPRLQSKQLNTAEVDSLLTLHSLPVSGSGSSTTYFQTWKISRIHLKFPCSPGGPSTTCTLFSHPPPLASTCTQYCRQPIPLSSK